MHDGRPVCLLKDLQLYWSPFIYPIVYGAFIRFFDCVRARKCVLTSSAAMSMFLLSYVKFESTSNPDLHREDKTEWLSAIWVHFYSFAVCQSFFSSLSDLLRSVMSPLRVGVRDPHSVSISTRVPPNKGPSTPL